MSLPQFAEPYVDDEVWTPIYFLASSQSCDFCFAPIPRSGLGPTPSEPRAVFSALRNVHECVGCHRERERCRRACEPGVPALGPSQMPREGTGDLGAPPAGNHEFGLTG